MITRGAAIGVGAGPARRSGCRSRDRRTHLGLKFAPLSVLVIDGALDRGDAQFMLADFDREVSTHLLNIRPEVQIARERPSANSQQDDGGLKQMLEI